jgi:hypothetical protein
MCLLLCCWLAAELSGGEISLELQRLNMVSIGVEAYAAGHQGKMPTSLRELGEYIDVPELLGAAPGSATQFSEDYGFFAPPLEVNLPMQGRVQIVLLRVQPREGVRGAIWTSSRGRFDRGLLRENELSEATADRRKLEELKPMGGVVPERPRRFAGVAEETTDYQKKVQALARAGKLPLDPPDVDPEDAPKAPATPAPENMKRATETAPSSSPGSTTSENPLLTVSSKRVLIIAVLFIVASGMLYIWRRHRR